MSNRFIVTDHKYRQHNTLEEAQQEMARLAAKFPNKPFMIHRIKGSLTYGDNAKTIQDLLARLARALNVCEEIAHDSRVDLVDSERRIRLYHVLNTEGRL